LTLCERAASPTEALFFTGNLTAIENGGQAETRIGHQPARGRTTRTIGDLDSHCASLPRPLPPSGSTSAVWVPLGDAAAVRIDGGIGVVLIESRTQALGRVCTSDPASQASDTKLLRPLWPLGQTVEGRLLVRGDGVSACHAFFEWLQQLATNSFPLLTSEDPAV
jgi:hypothetical protein